MGLLGEGWDDPKTMATMQLAAGLLGGGNFGQALGRGLSGYQQAISSAQDAADRKQMASLRAMQIEQARQKIQDEQDLKTLAQQYYKQPTMTTEQVFAAPGAVGPTAARAELIPNTQGEFDAKGFINAYAQKNPLAAMEMKAKLAKEVPINKLDVKDFTPASVQKFAQTGNYGDLVRLDKLHFADSGGSTKGLNPFTGAEVSSTEKTGNPFSDLLVMGPNGQLTVNQPLVSAKSAISRAGATNVKIENKMGESLAGQVGPMVRETWNAANGAVQTANAANDVLKAVDGNKLYTGPGANMRLSVAQLGDTLGVGGKDTLEKIANTRQALTGLAQMTLQGRKQMSGQGAITESESKLAERALSGDISMTAAEIKQLAGAAHRAAKFTYDQHQTQIGSMQQDPNLVNLSKFYKTAPFPGVYAPATSAAPVNANGAKFLGFE